uniref:Uncharacterized protein n=1 Tax=Marmota marmota marmota TaxID=9994 RepID=A0A8C5Z9H7_MARMA
MAGYQRKRVFQDEVHQNQFLREQYLRELRTQKLCTDYHVNPLRKGEDPGGNRRGARGHAGSRERPALVCSPGRVDSRAAGPPEIYQVP